jgi:hypothetical protein
MSDSSYAAKHLFARHVEVNRMKVDLLSRFLPSVIAIALVAIAIRPYIASDSAHAQNAVAYPAYIEPGVQMLK